MRDVARLAGVTHALIHRYFGTKAALFKAVLSRHENAIRNAAGDVCDPSEAALLMLHEGLRHHRSYLRLIAHTASRGTPVELGLEHFSGTERLVELARTPVAGSGRATVDESDWSTADAGELEHRLGVAMIVMLYLGYASTEEWVTKAAHVDHLDEETRVAALERAVRILAAQWPLA